MLDNIFIIKFTENLTENKKLCKAIGHPKRYYEAYLSHIVFELWPFTTFTGWKINFDKIILISQFIIIQHRRWQKFVKNIPNSKWWQDRVKYSCSFYIFYLLACVSDWLPISTMYPNCFRFLYDKSFSTIQ